jgi:hypothetical protein
MEQIKCENINRIADKIMEQIKHENMNGVVKM